MNKGRSIDQNLFFLQTEAIDFETTTVDEVSSNKTKIPDLFLLDCFTAFVLLDCFTAKLDEY